MSTERVVKKAVRVGQKARVALAGPSGSGKTWTALEHALVLADGQPVLVIDTERGSAGLYADEFEFDTVDWAPPYDPRELAACIGDNDQGYGCIVIDSLTHFWEGEGGTRDIVDAAASRAKGNSFAGWKEGTPAQNDMVAALLQARCHVIATMRSKTDYVLEDRGGKQIPRKVGMAPIQRPGIEYEFTVTADLDQEHTLLVDKSRCSLLAGKMYKAGHTVEMARVLAGWLATAAPAQLTDAQVLAERKATMQAWADALLPAQVDKWDAWKSEHEGWHKSATSFDEAYLVLRDLSVEASSAAGAEPWSVDASVVTDVGATTDTTSEQHAQVAAAKARRAQDRVTEVASKGTKP
jgi:hypothetical protein